VILQKTFLRERLTLETRTLLDLDSWGAMLAPRVTYSINDHLDVSAGLALFGGRSSTALGPYRDKDRLMLSVCYSL
jgi:hypothetical protein